MQTSVPSGRIAIKQVVAKFFTAIETILRVVGRFQWPKSSCSRGPISTNWHKACFNQLHREENWSICIYLYVCLFSSYVIAWTYTLSAKNLLEATKIIRKILGKMHDFRNRHDWKRKKFHWWNILTKQQLRAFLRPYLIQTFVQTHESKIFRSVFTKVNSRKIHMHGLTNLQVGKIAVKFEWTWINPTWLTVLLRFSIHVLVTLYM